MGKRRERVRNRAFQFEAKLPLFFSRYHFTSLSFFFSCFSRSLTTRVHVEATATARYCFTLLTFYFFFFYFVLPCFRKRWAPLGAPSLPTPRFSSLTVKRVKCPTLLLATTVGKHSCVHPLPYSLSLSRKQRFRWFNSLNRLLFFFLFGFCFLCCSAIVLFFVVFFRHRSFSLSFPSPEDSHKNGIVCVCVLFFFF